MPKYVTTVGVDEKVDLDAISTEPPKGISREDADAQFQAMSGELFELQDLMWGARTHSVLIVLQGMDTAGKDGAIKQVAGCLNPRGVSVTSFGVPTKEELEHDFLWRVHKVTPRRGEWALFNRSHYEDVLVVRVLELVPETLWKERYGHIRAFEETLAEHGTLIFKFFLHISKDEQKKRLLDREKDPAKAWKLNVNDWKTRERWDEFQGAYRDALRKTSTEHAPWTVVPADTKWFRSFAIMSALLEGLRPYRKVWQKKLDEMGQQGRIALDEYRVQREAKKQAAREQKERDRD